MTVLSKNNAWPGTLLVALVMWVGCNGELSRVSPNESQLGANLVQDPSFEGQAVSRQLNAPWFSAAEVSPGLQVGADLQGYSHTGAKSAFIFANNPTTAVWTEIYQDIDVQPNTSYQAGAFIKPSNIAGAIGVEVNGQALAQTPFNGSAPYTQYTVAFNSGNNTQVRLYVGVQSVAGQTGAINLDDLFLATDGASAARLAAGTYAFTVDLLAIDGGFGHWNIKPAVQLYLQDPLNTYQQWQYTSSGTLQNVGMGNVYLVDAGDGTLSESATGDTWTITQAGAGYTLKNDRTGLYVSGAAKLSMSGSPTLYQAVGHASNPPPPSVQAYYLAPNGNDGNPGTLAAPFATLARAQSAMQASSIKTTYLRSGSYSLPGVTLGATDVGEVWATYPEDPPQSAVLVYTGNGAPQFHFYGASNVTISNLTLDGGAGGGYPLLVEASSNEIHIQKNKFLNNSKNGDIYLFNSDNIYFQGNASGPNEYQPVSGHMTDGMLHSNIYVTDNQMSGMSRFGIELQDNNEGDPNHAHFQGVHVDRNVISGTFGMAISFVTGHNDLCNTAWGNTITGTPGMSQWAFEVATSGPAPSSYENNTITNVGAPFFIAPAAGTEIQNNTLSNWGDPYNNYAYNQDGWFNNTQWIGNNTLNGASVTGWPGMSSSVSFPGACAPSAQFQ